MTNTSIPANSLRFLAMDAVQLANSGHPGMPMGMADIATVLWHDFLKYNPTDPNWADRDRFMLSNGHGSMLLYALLHLSGYDLSIQDLKQFRQLHSITPGHPEHGMTPGVETTTGPLGQGLANAVGMALAERMLAAQFNQEGHSIVDHRTYAFVGDGCLMEGISHEACALAGTWQLGKLMVFFDDNHISIDGDIAGWCTTNVPERFRAYGWHVIDAIDGHDQAAIREAIEAAQATDRPSLLCCKTVIGFGSPNLAGSEKTHGAPLGDDEIAQVRAALDWPHAPFDIPQASYDFWDHKDQGQADQADWQSRWQAYQQAHPELAAEFERRMQGDLPADFDQVCEAFVQQARELKDMATRKSSLAWLEQAQVCLPELLGGSADLSGSNGTLWKGALTQSAQQPAGRYIRYGVREFGMTAIMNGISLHGGFLPYAGTFLVFSDYARNAVRLAALMQLREVFVYSHDSVALGEDGPTHQPIEHLASLRLIPGLELWRPADAVETTVAWIEAVKHHGPSAMVLTRQSLPALPAVQAQDIARGGYVVRDGGQDGDAVLIATGSEVHLALQAAEHLAEQSIQVRVVSMPCVTRFLSQSQSDQDRVLRSSVGVRCVIEAGVTNGWYRFVNRSQQIIGIDEFGVSAKGEDALRHFNITVETIVARVTALLAERVSVD